MTTTTPLLNHATVGMALTVTARGTGPEPTRPAIQQPGPWRRFRGALRRPATVPGLARPRQARIPWAVGPLPAAA